MRYRYLRRNNPTVFFFLCHLETPPPPAFTRKDTKYQPTKRNPFHRAILSPIKWSDLKSSQISEDKFKGDSPCTTPTCQSDSKFLVSAEFKRTFFLSSCSPSFFRSNIRDLSPFKPIKKGPLLPPFPSLSLLIGIYLPTFLLQTNQMVGTVFSHPSFRSNWKRTIFPPEVQPNQNGPLITSDFYRLI